MDEGRRRRMKAYGRPVRTGEHGCTFCPSLLSLHNPPCTAYGTGRLHKVLLGCKIKQREREKLKPDTLRPSTPKIDMARSRQDR